MLSLFEQMAGTRGPALLQEHLRVQTKRSNKKRSRTTYSTVAASAGLNISTPPSRFQSDCFVVVVLAIVVEAMLMTSMDIERSEVRIVGVERIVCSSKYIDFYFAKKDAVT